MNKIDEHISNKNYDEAINECINAKYDNLATLLCNVFKYNNIDVKKH